MKVIVSILFILLILFLCFQSPRLTRVYIISGNDTDIVGIDLGEFVDTLPNTDPPDTTTIPSVGRDCLILETTFEEPNPLAIWHATVPATHCCDFSQVIQTDTFLSSNHAIRFSLNRTDPDASGSKRSEINQSNTEPPNSIRWWGSAFYFPNSYVRDGSMEMILQWHHADNTGSPPLGIWTWNDHLWAVRRLCPDPACTEFRTDLGPIPKESWFDLVVYYNARFDASGHVTVWVGGVQKFDYSGQSAYQNKGNYVKTGIYKWEWKSRPQNSQTFERHYYQDDIRYGKECATYNSVAPHQL